MNEAKAQPKQNLFMQQDIFTKHISPSPLCICWRHGADDWDQTNCADAPKWMSHIYFAEQITCWPGDNCSMILFDILTESRLPKSGLKWEMKGWWYQNTARAPAQVHHTNKPMVSTDRILLHLLLQYINYNKWSEIKSLTFGVHAIWKSGQNRGERMKYIAKVGKENISEILVKMLEKETTEGITNYLIRKERSHLKWNIRIFIQLFHTRL